MTEFDDSFQISWHGGTVVVTPSTDIENMKWDLIEQVAEVVLTPMRERDVTFLVFDLTHVTYFGSIFLSLLLRCHKHVRTRGGEMALCGASETAAELLRITALDTLWAIYDTRDEALTALAG